LHREMSAKCPSGLALSHALTVNAPKFRPPCVVPCAWRGAPVEIAHNIIPLEYANAVRDYARGNLDEAELWAELTALGYDAFEIEWHIANPGQRME
jgi:hypothetical protein